MKIQVDCYAGYRGEETPRRLWIGRRSAEVAEVLDRWLAPDHRYFKVLTVEQELVIIRHDAETWEWELTYFQQGTAPVARPSPFFYGDSDRRKGAGVSDG